VCVYACVCMSMCVYARVRSDANFESAMN